MPRQDCSAWRLVSTFRLGNGTKTASFPVALDEGGKRLDGRWPRDCARRQRLRTVGAYHASKWALEGLSQSLAQEVAGFGIHITLIEPGGYSTDWSGPSAVHSDENPAYADVREAAKNRPSAATPATPAPPVSRS